MPHRERVQCIHFLTQSVSGKGVRNGGLWFELDILQNFYYLCKRNLIVFAYFMLVNLST